MTSQGRESDGQDQDGDIDRKAFANMRARFALLGYGLIDLADGSYLATRWNYCRALPDLHAASTLLRQLGGKS